MPQDAGFVFPPTYHVQTDAFAGVAGGTVNFYAAGTTTPLTVYSDSTLSTSLGSVVYTDSTGYPVASQGSSTRVTVYTGSALVKVIVKDVTGSTLYTTDNLRVAQASAAPGNTGSGIQGVKSKTANYTVATTDDGYILDCDPTSNEITITLLSAVTATDGFTTYIRHAGTTTSNVVKIITSGGETMSGSATTTTATVLTGGGEVLQLVSNGSSWDVVSRVAPRLFWQSPIPVVSRLSAPPTSPSAGAFYILASSPSGDWASYAQHDIVRANGQGGWIRYTPPTDCGWIAFVQGENVNYQFQDLAWVALSNITAPTPSALPYGVWQDRKTDGTVGGIIGATGAWTTAVLNTEVYNTITGASLASNKVSLPAGTYLVLLSHSQQDLSQGAVRLRLESTGTIYRSPNYNVDSAANSVAMNVPYIVVVPSTDNLIVEYYATSTGTTADFGPALAITSGSEYEVYRVLTVVSITAQQGPQGQTGPQGSVDSAYVTLTLANGANNDVSLGQGNVYRVTGPTGAFTITGIAGGTDGRLVEILNMTSQNMTIANASASSIAANRIDTLTGSDVTTTGKGCVRLRYSSTDSVWVVAGGVQS